MPVVMEKTGNNEALLFQYLVPYSGFTLERLGANTPALLDLVTCFAVTAVQDKVTAAQDRISGSTLERLGA